MESVPPNMVNIDWNAMDYSTTFQRSFVDMLERKIMVDATLVCEDARVECHRMILAACSAYFADLFSKHPCSENLVVCLVGVKGWQLNALIAFMYTGKISRITQEQLHELCSIARELKIQGLATNNNPYPSSESTNEELRSSTTGGGGGTTDSETSDHENTPRLQLEPKSKRKIFEKFEAPKKPSRAGKESDAVSLETDGKTVDEVAYKDADEGSNLVPEFANMVNSKHEETLGNSVSILDKNAIERESNQVIGPNVYDAVNGTISDPKSSAPKPFRKPRKAKRMRRSNNGGREGEGGCTRLLRSKLDKNGHSQEPSEDSMELRTGAFQTNTVYGGSMHPGTFISMEQSPGFMNTGKSLSIFPGAQPQEGTYYCPQSTSLVPPQYPNVGVMPTPNFNPELEFQYRLAQAAYLTMYGFTPSQAAGFYGVSEEAISDLMTRSGVIPIVRNFRANPTLNRGVKDQRHDSKEDISIIETTNSRTNQNGVNY